MRIHIFRGDILHTPQTSLMDARAADPKELIPHSKVLYRALKF